MQAVLLLYCISKQLIYFQEKKQSHIHRHVTRISPFPSISATLDSLRLRRFASQEYRKAEDWASKGKKIG